jgi:hypothetical protein
MMETNHLRLPLKVKRTWINPRMRMMSGLLAGRSGLSTLSRELTMQQQPNQEISNVRGRLLAGTSHAQQTSATMPSVVRMTCEDT